MSSFTMHPEFRLHGFSFSGKSELLPFVKKQFPSHYSFLSDLFDDKDYIIAKTSGSTGQPKPIRIPKKHLINSAEKTIKFFDLQPGTKVLLNLSSDFIAGKMMWVRALIGGWNLEVVLPENRYINNILQQKSFDFGAMVPLQMSANLNNIHKISKLIVGGGVVSKALQKKIIDLPNQIFATYGMTETITHIAVKPLNSTAEQNFYSDDSLKGFYQCLEGISISVDERDCLMITAKDIAENTIVTNDIVQIKDEKHFKWLGRYDNIINSGGIKLIPEEIEKKLASYIPVNFFIAGFPDEKLGQKLVLIVEAKQLRSIDFEQILSKYEIPKQIIFIDNMFLTSSGKINRNKVLESILKNNTFENC